MSSSATSPVRKANLTPGYWVWNAARARGQVEGAEHRGGAQAHVSAQGQQRGPQLSLQALHLDGDRGLGDARYVVVGEDHGPGGVVHAGQSTT